MEENLESRFFNSQSMWAEVMIAKFETLSTEFVETLVGVIGRLTRQTKMGK